jgi:MoxR-vWA-beta-propeller ternary system domain bpX5
MIALTWQQRTALGIAPLKPVALWATAQQLQACAISAQRQQQLRCLVTQSGWLVLSMGEGELPWIDGVTWLGRDAAFANILMPTLLRPSLPPEWLSAAIQKLQLQGSESVMLPADDESTNIVPITTSVSLNQALRWYQYQQGSRVQMQQLGEAR